MKHCLGQFRKMMQCSRRLGQKKLMVPGLNKKVKKHPQSGLGGKRASAWEERKHQVKRPREEREGTCPNDNCCIIVMHVIVLILRDCNS